MPRPRSLTTADLATAALAVIDRAGLSGLTMRAVAKELHVATMALYRYVADRDQLEVLVVDRVLGGVDLSVPAGDWREQLRALLDRMRVAVSAHPAVVPLLMRHRQSATATLHIIEAMLGVLAAAGFSGHDRVLAQRTLVGFLLGHLQNEHYAALAGPGTAAMAELVAADYPHLTETAAEARGLAPAEEFHGGLDIVLRGLTPPGS
ncbi:TetR/AcrR family transcriptional regulator [Nocardia sp. XZ_19_385]|uniref:TetR/AcrR family transcriptional regulator n=1 Tax=Nocardia sp. XZ_19_385 TaxID=2769488 RepID=UPI00188F8BAB|nr:TetR/AcrR family transcriptional regulator C-terminal domain-containing protein [Nocardia sp. XZ_19_385]